MRRLYFQEVDPIGLLLFRLLWILFSLKMLKFHALFPIRFRKDIFLNLRAKFLSSV